MRSADALIGSTRSASRSQTPGWMRRVGCAGLDATVLSEFRSRIVTGSAELRLLDLMLVRFAERGWLKARGRQRTDSTQVLAKIRALNRVLCVAQTLAHVLAVLAHVLAVLALCWPRWLHSGCAPCQRW
jgi:hypothetical protein